MSIPFKNYSLIGALALMALAVPASVLAASYRSSDTVTVAKDQVIPEDLYVSGNDIVIDGTVDGDLIAAGRNITVNGTITGGLIAAGSTVTVTGRIGNDARIVAGTVVISGQIKDVLDAAGGTVTVERDGSIGGDSHLAGNELTIAGHTGSVYSTAGSLTLAKSARIEGNLRYASDTGITREEGSTVTGSTEIRQLSTQRSAAESVLQAVLSLLATILFAGLFLLLFPMLLFPRPDSFTDIVRAFGIGLVTLLVAPLILVVALATGIGTVPGIVLLLALPCLMYAGWLTAVLIAGNWVRGNLPFLKGVPSPWGEAVSGGILLTVLAVLPLGIIVKAVAVVIGTGYLVHRIATDRHQKA